MEEIFDVYDKEENILMHYNEYKKLFKCIETGEKSSEIVVEDKYII